MVDNPEKLGRSPGLSVLGDFVTTLVSYLGSAEEKKDDLFYSQFLESYGVKLGYYEIVLKAFADAKLWNEEGTAIDTYMAGRPMILEGLEILRNRKPRVGRLIQF